MTPKKKPGSVVVQAPENASCMVPHKVNPSPSPGLKKGDIALKNTRYYNSVSIFVFFKINSTRFVFHLPRGSFFVHTIPDPRLPLGKHSSFQRFIAFFFFFSFYFRLSARISDFENVLLMVHVVGYMLAPQAHGTQLFFFSTPDFDFFGTFEHSPLHIFFS